MPSDTPWYSPLDAWRKSRVWFYIPSLSSCDASQNDPALHARVQALFQLNLAHMLARDNDQPDIATVPRHGRRVAGVLDCLTDGSGGGRTVLVGEGQDDVAVLAGEGQRSGGGVGVGRVRDE
jgi:hypothetical protein